VLARHLLQQDLQRFLGQKLFAQHLKPSSSSLGFKRRRIVLARLRDYSSSEPPAIDELDYLDALRELRIAEAELAGMTLAGSLNAE
jgi:hypothetical protein